MSRMAAGRSGWLSAVILSAGTGLLAALALPPLGWPPLLWLALAGLWSLTSRPWSGLVWGWVAVAISHRWLLGLHPLDWIGVPLPLSLPLCLLLLALISGLGGGLVAVWLAAARCLDPSRWTTALLLALLWGVGETLLARGPLFWLGLGASALPADRPLAALAALGGAGLVAALQLVVGWVLWRLLLHPSHRRRWAAVLSVLLVLSHGLGGAVLLRQPVGPAATGAAKGAAEQVLVLQPAIPTREKFEPLQRLSLQRQLANALEQGRRQGADLLVLPEGAMGLEPRLPDGAPIELISGGFRWHEGPEVLEQRSALLRFAPGQAAPTSWLDKHRLVPLGEWVPLSGLARWSGLSAVGGVEPGAASRLLRRPTAPLAAAICYELSDGGAQAAAVRDGARWLLASANLDPYPALLQRQFAALAQLRALETGRWLVSAANTGPSLLINPRAQVMAALPAGASGTGLFTVPLLQPLTPYDRFGDAPLLLLTLAAAVLRWRWRG
jgi:apolipoprotein N-acyltransferase